MHERLNLTGRILVTPPRNSDAHFSKGVVFIARHSSTGAWGLMFNKPTPKLTLDQIMFSVGIMSNKKDRIYLGGPIDTHRVYILHSMDWSSSSTIQITSDIGITNDMTILSAISVNEGPALFRTCLGMASWGPGQLDGEYYGESPWKQENRWLDAPATIESIFDLQEEEQWNKAIEMAAREKISKWF
jgi:putative transcriptional regulator